MSAHKSVWLASIFVAIILIGLVVLTFNNPSMTAYTTKDQNPKLCYVQINEKLVPEPNIADCCLSLSNSIGCQTYQSSEISDELYRCKSDRIIVANKALIDFCIGK